jgi:hypothetical protein
VRKAWGFVPLKKSRCVRSVLSFSFRRGQSSGKRELMVFPPFSFSASTSDYKTFSFFISFGSGGTDHLHGG